MMNDRVENTTTASITVAGLIEKGPPELELSVIAGAGGMERQITSDRIQKLGLGLTGFVKYLRSGRIKVVGQSEISFISELQPNERTGAFERLIVNSIPCILLTKHLEPPPELVEFSNRNEIALLHTPQQSSKAIAAVTTFLQEQLAPQMTIHGVVLEMYGLGVLMLGRSGIGKSECALDLVSRGHRLIADDSVRVKKIASRLYGESPEITREHLEIRGLGIINVRELFGISAIGSRIPIQLCVQLDRWNPTDEVERLGLEMDKKEIFGVEIPKFVLPVSSGRNLAILVETAVRVFLLRRDGVNAVERLIEKHTQMISAKR